MTKETKLQIVEAAKKYCAAQGWVNGTGETGVNKLADASGVSVMYLSNILREVFQYQNARTGKMHDISDDHFERLAKAIDYSYQKEYWGHVDTEQFRDLIFELKNAKENALTRVIVGDSGCGKSYSIDKFRRAMPMATWVIKCFREDTLGDLLRKIETEMRIKGEGSTSQRIDRISLEFFRQRGNNPILIIDEAEALTVRTFAMLKALYDALSFSKAMVLIGTSDLLDTMDRAKLTKRPGMPQFYRRFKSGIRVLERIDVRYSAFFAGLNLPREFVRYLTSICENYGELHDYIEPAMRKADEMGQEFTQEFFKNYHRMG